MAGPWLGLRAALLLARGRHEGVALLIAEAPEAQRARAVHSFVAMLFCLPVFLAVQEVGRDLEGLAMLRQAGGVAIGWLGYAVLSHRIGAAIGREAQWPRFIVLWNWCNLVQYLLVGAALLPSFLGVPAMVAQTAWIVAMGWAMWLQWSATRLGLALPGGRAALLVVTDMALGIAVMRATAG